ncbi:MAG: TIGR03000 domain-containing protein [Pirellulaceae bacterium]
MFRRTLMIGALAAAMIAISATAQAGWRHGWGYYGYGGPVLGWTGYDYGYYAGWGGAGCCDSGAYRPAYVPAYTSCYTGCYDPCYRGSCLSRLSYRWNAHHYGYYWGSRRAYWGGTSCCSTCGSSTDCGCGGGEVEGDVLYGAPSVVPDATPQSPTPAVPPTPGSDLPTPEKQTSLSVDSALLTVNVPADARVLVNGMSTRSTGDLRRYVSRNLNPGFDYSYEVTAEANIGGKVVTQTKMVNLRAGGQAELAFDLRAQAPVETALTIHVPSDARVFLAGNETRGNGSVRTFRTTKIDGGKAWSMYAVKVTVVRDGEDLTKEKTITLRAGDQAELTFDFEADKVADAR